MSVLPKGAVKIYNHVEQIKAVKGDKSESLWPNEAFVHDFSAKSKAAIYGLPNGDLLIRSQVGKRLWGRYNYPGRKRK